MYFSVGIGSDCRMFPAVFLEIVGILCSISSAQDVSTNERGLAALQTVATSNLNFTKSIYKILSQTDGNVFFSPASIHVALAMTYMGSGGETALQMARGLHLPEDNEIVTAGFNSLVASIKRNDEVTLEIANKIFTDNAIPLKNEFRGIAQKSFVSDVEAVDFKNNHEAARVQINQWVEGKTNQKIKDLLAQGVITPETALVLVNALYFKGEWQEKFTNYSTKSEPFFLTPTQTKNVQMMHDSSWNLGFKVSEELNCKILELPYKGDKVSMVVFLPNELDGLANLESRLHSVDLKQLLSRFESPEVIVTLPKFKIEQSTDLNDVLKKLGMVDMFEDRANFSVLTDAPVKVSKVAHKAFIEINKDGTEAAASTALIGVPLSAWISTKPPQVFKADHPFLFVLREKTTQTVLFIGRVSDPSKT